MSSNWKKYYVCVRNLTQGTFSGKWSRKNNIWGSKMLFSSYQDANLVFYAAQKCSLRNLVVYTKFSFRTLINFNFSQIYRTICRLNFQQKIFLIRGFWSKQSKVYAVYELFGKNLYSLSYKFSILAAFSKLSCIVVSEFPKPFPHKFAILAARFLQAQFYKCVRISQLSVLLICNFN